MFHFYTLPLLTPLLSYLLNSGEYRICPDVHLTCSCKCARLRSTFLLNAVFRVDSPGKKTTMVWLYVINIVAQYGLCQKVKHCNASFLETFLQWVSANAVCHTVVSIFDKSKGVNQSGHCKGWLHIKPSCIIYVFFDIFLNVCLSVFIGCVFFVCLCQCPYITLLFPFKVEDLHPIPQ